MRNIYISLIVWFVCNTQIFGNTFVQGENYQFKSIMFLQDTTSENESEFQLETFKEKGSFKSPGKALLYSGVLPGMGQAYMDNWLRGLLFVGLDAAAIGTWYYNNNLAEDKKREYFSYADKNWKFANWIHDYYEWYTCDDESCNEIRNVFLNADSLYTDIWNHSHKVEFKYDHNVMGSNSEEFKKVFKYLCGNTNLVSRDCSNSIDKVEEILIIDSIYVIADHHFYEGIQKYDMFFAGWVDAVDSVMVDVKPSGDQNVISPIQNAYRSIWSDYNTIKTLAGNGGKFMLINRFVSMVDALLLAKKWNNTHDMKLSLNAYPDLRNKSGLGGVKLSLYWE